MRSPTALVATLFLAGCAASAPGLTGSQVASPYFDISILQKGQIVHLPTGRLMSRDELMGHLEEFPVVYVGETHDNVYDHEIELDVLKHLTETFPDEVALGLEMLRRPFQKDVDAYLAGEMDDHAFVRDVWSKSWGPTSWPYYRDLLHFAREHGVPVLALNAGKDLQTAVRNHEFDDLPPEFAARLPEDMDTADPYHRAFAEAMLMGHDAGSRYVDVFLRIQTLWDETMADTAARALTAGPDAPSRLVVMAGANHVRYGFGIPRRLFRRVPLPYVVLTPYLVEIPESKRDRLMDVDLPDLPLRVADFYWGVGYADLEGDRVMLGVRTEAADGGGVRVIGVMPESPAAGAGIQAGDVIVEVDGEKIDGLYDLTYQVGLHKPGDRGLVVVNRNGEEKTLEVTYDAAEHGR